MTAAESLVPDTGRREGGRGGRVGQNNIGGGVEGKEEERTDVLVGVEDDRERGRVPRVQGPF